MTGRIFPRRSITARLMLSFAAMLVAFTVLLTLIYNAIMERQMIAHYSASMQRDAYAISQNLAELFAPSSYDALDDTRFIVSEETLTPYLALIEHITRCNVYLVDTQHSVTGYFDGVVQSLGSPLLPAYIEQSIALGFMGKTPFIQSEQDGEVHLTACMPVMNAHSRVLGVVLLESTLRELGYAQVPSATVLLASCVIAFFVSVALSFILSRHFTRPISKLEQVALSLAGGHYETRTQLHRRDEIGSLASSMDVLAERLEEARQRDKQLHIRQQEFFSNISHELKTPVTVIRGSLEALSDGVVQGEKNIRAYYAQMIRESRWLQRLIQDLLELSRLQNLEFSLNLSDVDIAELTGDVAMSAHALCESKGITFDCSEPSLRYVFPGDYPRLRQMLLAVIDNAVKFTSAGKSIRLRIDEDAPAIIISDEGTGIPPAELPYIFDRFHHTHDSSRESTGLGLAIVKEIAQRHGIRVDVHSREGDGTAFIFTLPAQ